MNWLCVCGASSRTMTDPLTCYGPQACEELAKKVNNEQAILER